MKTEGETRTGYCPTHGRVEATRELPRLRFPYVYYGMLRWRARRQPYVCPQCGAAVTMGRSG